MALLRSFNISLYRSAALLISWEISRNLENGRDRFMVEYAELLTATIKTTLTIRGGFNQFETC